MTHAELKELAKRATPGPWIASGVTSRIDGTRFMFVNCEPLGEICRVPFPDYVAAGYAPSICDQHFIAAANPAAIIDLIERLERAEEALRFYANSEIYKPHPHGLAFDRRDLSSTAIGVLEKWS